MSEPAIFNCLIAVWIISNIIVFLLLWRTHVRMLEVLSLVHTLWRANLANLGYNTLEAHSTLPPPGQRLREPL